MIEGKVGKKTIRKREAKGATLFLPFGDPLKARFVLLDTYKRKRGFLSLLKLESSSYQKQKNTNTVHFRSCWISTQKGKRKIVLMTATKKKQRFHRTL